MRQTGLDSFFTGNTHNYEELLHKIKTIEEAEKNGKDIRELEMVLFTPNDNKSFSNIKQQEQLPGNFVKVYFKNSKYYDLFCKFFKVNKYVENNVHRIEPIILFLLLLDKGIVCKEENGGIITLKFNTKEAIFDTRETK